jgi:hypothetical protein
MPIAVIVTLLGCAQAPNHQWHARANIDHIPMQGLPAPPRVISGDQPIKLVNFGNESEINDMQGAASAAGAAQGATYGAVAAAQLGPACVVMPPLCVGLIVVGAAIGTAGSARSTVSREDAARLGTIFSKHATSASLQKLVSNAFPKANGQREFPWLEVNVIGVLLVPARNGVSFRLVAQARASPAPNDQWKQTLHVVAFPSHPTEHWLASEGKFLLNELNKAFEALSTSIVPTYQAIEDRGH